MSEKPENREVLLAKKTIEIIQLTFKGKATILGIKLNQLLVKLTKSGEIRNHNKIIIEFYRVLMIYVPTMEKMDLQELTTLDVTQLQTLANSIVEQQSIIFSSFSPKSNKKGFTKIKKKIPTPTKHEVKESLTEKDYEIVVMNYLQASSSKSIIHITRIQQAISLGVSWKNIYKLCGVKHLPYFQSNRIKNLLKHIAFKPLTELFSNLDFTNSRLFRSFANRTNPYIYVELVLQLLRYTNDKQDILNTSIQIQEYTCVKKNKLMIDLLLLLKLNQIIHRTGVGYKIKYVLDPTMSPDRIIFNVLFMAQKNCTLKDAKRFEIKSELIQKTNLDLMLSLKLYEIAEKYTEILYEESSN